MAAALAVQYARGSPQRLFVLVYAVGTVVTVFLSNDATAVVLTPLFTPLRGQPAQRPCLICSFVHSLPTRQVLCCQSQIRLIW